MIDRLSKNSPPWKQVFFFLYEPLCHLFTTNRDKLLLQSVDILMNLVNPHQSYHQHIQICHKYHQSYHQHIQVIAEMKVHNEVKI